MGAENAAAGGRGSAYPLLWRLAHIAPRGVLILGGFYLVADVLFGGDPPFWLTGVPATLATVLLLASFRHDYVLCGICAARTPLDGAAEATRCDWQLHLHHRFLVQVVALLLLGGPALASFIVDYPKLISRVVSDVGLLAVAGQMYVSITHRLLQPWCPYCHWDDGGDHEPSPEPDPVNEQVQA